MSDTLPALGADDLRRIARGARAAAAARPGCACRGLRCRGWESLPASFDVRQLVRLGRVAAGAGEFDPYADLTLEEFHPGGTRYESPDAPIAVGRFPYNRCEAWACGACGRAFLRYTEYGGYYVDARIRELADESLIVDAVPPAAG
jgi:hypothetical protein